MVKSTNNSKEKVLLKQKNFELNTVTLQSVSRKNQFLRKVVSLICFPSNLIVFLGVTSQETPDLSKYLLNTKTV